MNTSKKGNNYDFNVIVGSFYTNRICNIYKYGTIPMIAYYVGGMCHALFWILQSYDDNDDDF